MWDELVEVSDGFINERIQEGIKLWKENFYIYDFNKIRETEFNNAKNAACCLIYRCSRFYVAFRKEIKTLLNK